MSNRANYLRALRDEFAADGRFIEAGWADLCMTAPADIGPEELCYLRAMFFAGASHLFECVTRGVGDKPTRQGLEFLGLIRAELRQNHQDEALEHVTAGHA